MERYGNTWAYSEEEVLDIIVGPIGSPDREAFERELEEDIRQSLARQEAQREKEAVHKALFEEVEEPDAVMA